MEVEAEVEAEVQPEKRRGGEKGGRIRWEDRVSWRAGAPSDGMTCLRK